jgi:excisionase family DNA binding protein
VCSAIVGLKGLLTMKNTSWSRAPRRVSLNQYDLSRLPMTAAFAHVARRARDGRPVDACGSCGSRPRLGWGSRARPRCGARCHGQSSQPRSSRSVSGDPGCGWMSSCLRSQRCVNVSSAVGASGMATLWNWINAGTFPAVRVGDRRFRIKRSDLDAYLDANPYAKADRFWSEAASRSEVPGQH